MISRPDVGLAAARAYGLPWERTLPADDPGDHWAEVASVLADACDTGGGRSHGLGWSAAQPGGRGRFA
ncbi:hypothetical protein [Kitasatospora sp. NPDC001547]|uniref:hypothetical protein n=1 Tax=Kitasatospora sp. NPDC001547 TaxID=3364015 RepID=UPI0036A2E2AA|nr:hypothetical protein KitaXyl93_75520 [Kitasatospora sp. Xyl93]